MITDPVERVIADGLDQYDIPYEHEKPVGNHRIDFFLPNEKVYIECKRFHTDRIDRQMFGIRNYIVINGMEAVQFFKDLCFAAQRSTL